MYTVIFSVSVSKKVSLSTQYIVTTFSFSESKLSSENSQFLLQETKRKEIRSKQHNEILYFMLIAFLQNKKCAAEAAHEKYNSECCNTNF